jgi:hypothetical protein
VSPERLAAELAAARVNRGLAGHGCAHDRAFGELYRIASREPEGLALTAVERATAGLRQQRGGCEHVSIAPADVAADRRRRARWGGDSRSARPARASGWRRRCPGEFVWT